MMDEYKKAAEILEMMTEEPEPGHEARLDADELDAVLMAIRVLTGDASTIRNAVISVIEQDMFIDEEYQISRKDIDISERNTSFWVKDTRGNEREFAAIRQACWESSKGVRDEDGELYNPNGFICSGCGHWSHKKTRYCSKCGAEME